MGVANTRINHDNKCSFCAASKCCTCITQSLDTPRSKADFNHLLWQASHAGVEVYKDSSGWYLLFQAVCGHLQIDGTCGIYAQRPPVCREYDNEYCEYDAPAEDGFLLHFRNYGELLRYCRTRFKTWDKN